MWQFEVTDINLDGLSSMQITASDSSISSGNCMFGEGEKCKIIITGKGVYKKVMTTTDIVNKSSLVLKGMRDDWEGSTSAARTLTISKIQLFEYQEGMENLDIPYFEGMISVKMPVLTTCGKNLFDIDYVTTILNDASVKNSDGLTINKSKNNGVGLNFIKLFEGMFEPNQQYRLSYTSSANDTNGTKFFIQIVYTDGTTSQSYRVGVVSLASTQNKTISHLVFSYGSSATSVKFTNLSLTRGESVTPFEPHRSNILSTNEEVVLRSTGNVKDELNLVTGEKVERVGEMLSINGSEHAWYGTAPDFYLPIPNMIPYKDVRYGQPTVISNLYPSFVGQDEGNFILSSWEHPHLRVHDLTVNSVPEFKAKLDENPLDIVYVKNTEVIKTVDLLILDQDNNPVNWMSAFKDTTYIESLTTAENSLAGEVMVEVPTKVEDAYNAVQILLEGCKTSLAEIDEIQNEQEMDSILVMNSQAELYDLILSNQGGDIL